MSANFEEIARRLREGTLVPFLGAAASTYARPEGYLWDTDETRAHPPTARELRDHLVKRSVIPIRNLDDPTDDPDLAQMASRFLVGAERHELDERVYDAVATCASPSPLHDYLAGLARVTPLLFLTTNYDRLLERALEAAGARYHVVVDMTAHVEHKGSVALYRNGAGPADFVAARNLREDHLGINDDKLSTHSIIFKIHGGVDPTSNRKHAFVITEEDYVSFLGRMIEETPLPGCLTAKLRNSAFLFLGYSLADWNLRVLLNNLRGNRRHFLVNRSFTDFHLQLLQNRKLTGIKIDLADLVAGLEAASP